MPDFPEHESGLPVLVSAGAGTGKTTVLVEQFLRMVTSGGVPVTDILALTYTEKAAHEMKKRIYDGLVRLKLDAARRQLESAWISTLHAFTARILREHPLEALVDPDFRVMEPEEAGEMKSQSALETFERLCGKGSASFEFIRIYGESGVTDGMARVFQAARQEGRTLGEFFELKAARRISGDGAESQIRRGIALFESLGERELAAGLQSFRGPGDWDWARVDAFRAWASGFSRKQGQAGEKEAWQEIKKEICPAILAYSLEGLTAPWTEVFEAMGLGFEERYESLKREKNGLDFDDLQIRALRLLKREDPAGRKLLKRYQSRFRRIMVDEFQDTNRLQFELVSLLSTGGNLFLVGDYKQSIYGFRGAEPKLFLNAEEAYRDPEKGRRVFLNTNYRSAPPILDFVNAFFSRLWEEDGFRYERLLAGAKDKGGCESCVELLVTETEEAELVDSARMREAARIAERVLELREEGVPFGDMVLLFQAMTSVGIYEHALKSAGIPYFAVAGRGFYHQPEIRDMVSFLSFLENPRSDIPLAAALRSPLFQLRDDTLFWLSRAAAGGGSPGSGRAPLWEGIKSVEGIAEIPEEEKRKVRFFLETSKELLSVKDRLRLTELLDLILARTSYELTVLADPQGVRRYANLKKMINLAREFESFEPMRLGSFLATVRRLETEEVRESEAQIETESSASVVRLMTIHKSKGLEFPVVFVADLGRERVSRESAKIIAQAETGYALQAIHPVTLENEATQSWSRIHDAAVNRVREEWKRLFYVAATRAKRRLVLSGFSSPAHPPEESPKKFSQMSSWMDWLTAMRGELGAVLTVCTPKEAKRGRRPTVTAQKKEFQGLLADFKPRPAEKLLGEGPKAVEISRQADALIARVSRKIEVPRRTIDLPVSAYAAFHQSPEEYRRVYEIGYTGDSALRVPVPEVEAEGAPGLSAADFGTRMHAVFEFMDFERPEESLAAALNDRFGDVTDEEKREAARIVRQFSGSGLFAKIRGARRVFRELPFVLNERHGLVQGVVDLLFEDAGGKWHVVDYKTAAGDAEKAEASGYCLQVMIYALAVRRLAGLLPASTSVYFLKNDYEHTLPVDEKGLGAFEARLCGMQERILENFVTVSDFTV
ncbi:MAG: UvrD-helicase domain-containing protein [Candidatus Omnitrophota bacterium]|jgi:ATP-dependent helicase/nuclease subunit A